MSQVLTASVLRACHDVRETTSTSFRVFLRIDALIAEHNDRLVPVQFKKLIQLAACQLSRNGRKRQGGGTSRLTDYDKMGRCGKSLPQRP